MDRQLSWALTMAAALTLASPALAETREITQAEGAWEAVVCVDAEIPQAARVAELKAQAAMVRAREADRVYGHEAHSTTLDGPGLRVASYSSGRMQAHRVTTWGDHDAATGREMSCARVMEGPRHG